MSSKKYEKTYGKLIHWYGRSGVICSRNLEEDKINYLNNTYITYIEAENSRILPDKENEREARISITLKKVDSVSTKVVYTYIFLFSIRKIGEAYMTPHVEINYISHDVISSMSKDSKIEVSLELNEEDSKDLYERITEAAQKCVKQNLLDLSQSILERILSKVKVPGLTDKE